jgi:hypothetical protein
MRDFTISIACCLVLGGCLLQSPQYEGTEFSCAGPEASCPDGYVCVAQVCQPPGDTPVSSNPDAGVSDPPDADVPSPDADVPSPDADVPLLMTVTLSGAAVSDTYVSSADPDANNSDRHRVRVDADAEKNGLVRFDLSSIPTSAVVESAVVEVYIDEVLEDGELVGHRMLEDWSELEATWYQRKAGVLWSAAGAGTGTYDPSPLFSFAPRTSGTYMVPLPLATVQGWVSQVLPNYGVRWMSNSIPGSGTDFASTSSSSHPGPRLRIEYWLP